MKCPVQRGVLNKFILRKHNIWVTAKCPYITEVSLFQGCLFKRGSMIDPVMTSVT